MESILADLPITLYTCASPSCYESYSDSLHDLLNNKINLITFSSSLITLLSLFVSSTDDDAASVVDNHIEPSSTTSMPSIDSNIISSYLSFEDLSIATKKYFTGEINAQVDGLYQMVHQSFAGSASSSLNLPTL
eukprot:4287397-Ditylum_brightwellii.AAC.1